jgi:hypothetical protein
LSARAFIIQAAEENRQPENDKRKTEKAAKKTGPSNLKDPRGIKI